MTTPLLRASLLLLTLTALPSASMADVIDLHFTGKVDAIFDATGRVGPVAHVGSGVEIDIRYVTDGVLDLNPDDPTGGVFFPGGWMRVRIGHSLFEFTPQIGVATSNGDSGGYTVGGEYFEVQAPLAFPSSPSAWPENLPIFAFTGMSIVLAQTAAPFDLLSSDALPLSIDIRRADIREGSISSSTGDENKYSIHFRIPEPGTSALLGLGLAWTVARVRRRLHRV